MGAKWADFVKTAGLNPGETPIGIKYLKDITGNTQESLWGLSGDDNAAYTTPSDARRAAYRMAWKREKGDRFSMAEADRAADSDMRKAQERRWQAISRVDPEWSKDNKFSPSINYGILPHWTFTPSSGTTNLTSYVFGGVGDKVPMGYTEPEARSTAMASTPRRLNGRKLPGVVRGVVFKRIGDYLTNLYNKFHEMMHVVTPGAEVTSSGKNSTWPIPIEHSKGLSYANKPDEMLVGALAGKTWLRAKGVDEDKATGSRWAYDKLQDRAKGKKGGLTGDDYYEGLTNIRSLENMLFTIYDKAMAKGATPEDKKALDDFLNQLNYYFSVAHNDSRNIYNRSHKTAVV